MSIRILALYVVVTGLSVYAWKDWFKSLCGLILLMAVFEHGDMPKAMFGIPGCNPWNVLFLAIVLAWLVNRRREGLWWDMPGLLTWLLLAYLGVIVIGVLRAIFDPSHLEGYLHGTMGMIFEELINRVKWALPGILLFDGCRTRKRAVMALTCILVLYFLIAVEVVRNMPFEAALGSNLRIMEHARLKLNERVGYQATDLAVLLAGGCWGLLAALPLIRAKACKVMVLAAAGVVTFSVALTGGRGGYLAWTAAGLTLCLIKWRRYLILAPIALVLLMAALPGARARMLKGFGQTDVMGQSTIDEDHVSGGRLVVWPYVIDKIGESPWIGYGRRAMQRTGLMEYLLITHGRGDAVAHPHNVYLETLLENGIIGSIPIISFFMLMVVYSAKLFRSSNRLYAAVGGLALALMLTSLTGGLSGQHYFPQEHTLGIWAAILLSSRVYLEEKRVLAGARVYAGSLGPSMAGTTSGSELVARACSFREAPE